MTDAEALLRLLGPTVKGREQSPNGSYAGDSQELSLADIADHFEDRRTFAFDAAPAVVARRSNNFTPKYRPRVVRRSRFLAFDIDDTFKTRMALLGAVIRERKLEAASIATSGSDANRGKVVIFFARPRPASAVRRLGRELLETAKHASPDTWGVESSTSVAIFPAQGEGGVLRIGGRNRKPSRAACELDRFFSVDGERRSLADVVATARLFRLGFKSITAAPESKWVANMRKQGVSYQHGGSRGVLRRLSRLAREALSVHGEQQGRSVFESWARDVLEASQDQRAPSPSGDTRVARTWERRCANAWDWAVQTTSYSPGGRNMMWSGALVRCGSCERILTVVRDYCAKKRLTEDAFALSYRQIADFAGFADPKTPWKHVHDHLLPAAVLVIYDRGTNGENGLPTLFGLVAPGETPAETKARGETRGNVRKRRQIIAAYEARREHRSKPGAHRSTHAIPAISSTV